MAAKPSEPQTLTATAINDLQELYSGSNPFLADSDGDSIPDGHDTNPHTKDQFLVNDYLWTLDSLSKLSISPATNATPIGPELWQMQISAIDPLSEQEIGFDVKYDASKNLWWGTPDNIALIQSYTQASTWSEIKLHWLLDMIFNHDQGLEKSLLSFNEWQHSPSFLFKSKDIAFLSDVSENALSIGEHSFTFTATVESDNTTVISEPTLESLKISPTTNTFTAIVSEINGQKLEIHGRYDNGILSGSNGSHRITGGIADIFRVNVLIENSKGSTFASANLRSIDSTDLNPSLVQISDESNINWGRWTHFASLTEQDIAHFSTDERDMLSNSHFVLIRETAEDYQLPAPKRYQFTLNNYEAVYQKQQHIEAAHIESSSLELDTSNNRFAMNMAVSAPSLRKTESLRAYGEITKDGRLFSESDLSDTRAEGFLLDTGKQANLLFEKDLGIDEHISGISQWLEKQ